MARRFWPNGDALGKRIDFCSFDKKPCWLSIVGIVGNVHQFELEGEPTFDVYFSLDGHHISSSVQRRTRPRWRPQQQTSYREPTQACRLLTF